MAPKPPSRDNRFPELRFISSGLLGLSAPSAPSTSATWPQTRRRSPVASLAGVQALMDAGAMLVGKATLHEIGGGAGRRHPRAAG